MNRIKKTDNPHLILARFVRQVLGALIKAKELVKLESIKKVIQEHFVKDGGKNAQAAEMAFQSTKGDEN